MFKNLLNKLNWKFVAAGVSVAVGVAAVLYSPVLLAGLIASAAKSSVFGVFGAYAATAASVTAAVVIAAATAAALLLASYVPSAWNWARTPKSAPTSTPSTNSNATIINTPDSNKPAPTAQSLNETNSSNTVDDERSKTAAKAQAEKALAEAKAKAAAAEHKDGLLPAHADTTLKV